MGDQKSAKSCVRAVVFGCPQVFYQIFVPCVTVADMVQMQNEKTPGTHCNFLEK